VPHTRPRLVVIIDPGRTLAAATDDTVFVWGVHWRSAVCVRVQRWPPASTAVDSSNLWLLWLVTAALSPPSVSYTHGP